jgi:hypothetical protein
LDRAWGRRRGRKPPVTAKPVGGSVPGADVRVDREAPREGSVPGADVDPVESREPAKNWDTILS